MENLSVGEVVLATFPFSDLTSRKLRPCLVVGIAEFNDVILCQITSRRYASNRAIFLAKTDFSQGTIITDSFMRPDKLATLDKSIVKKILGKINSTKLKEVKLALKAVLEIA